MVLRKLSQSLKVTLAIMVSVFSSGLLQPAVAYASTNAPRTNAGDTKVVDELDGSEVPNDEPILTDCDLGVEFYNFMNTTDEVATVTFQPQAPTEYVIINVTGNQAPVVPGDGDGDPNGSNDMDGAHLYSLSFTGAPKTQGNVNGYHVKVLTDVSNTTGGAKQKVFWMPASCGTAPIPADPTTTATTQPCKQDDVTTDVIVTVNNVDDATDGSVIYTVTMGAQTKTITIADNGSAALTFTGLPVGNYTANVSGNDGTIATSNTVVVTSCQTQTTPPAGSLTVDVTCEAGSFSGSVTAPVGGTPTYTINGDAATPGSFSNVTPGQYTIKMYVNGILVDTEIKTVVACEPASPTTTAAAMPCQEGDVTKDVDISVTNTDDDTNDSVIYTISIGNAQATKQIALADGANGTVTFSGLPAGTYTATVTGNDNTSANSNQVVVTECGGRGGNAPCTVSNNTYLSPWTYGEFSYPEADDYMSGGQNVINNGTYEFKPGGLYLSTTGNPDYVFGITDAGNTKFVDVEKMGYMTLRELSSTGANHIVPAYVLYVDLNGDAAGGEDYLIYEPVYTEGAYAIQTGTWQTWDTYKNGDAKYWSANGTSAGYIEWSTWVENNPDGVVLAYGFNQGTGNPGLNAAIQSLQFDCATTTFGKAPVLGDNDNPTTPTTPTTPTAPTAPGQALGTSTTTTPQTLGTALLPAVLPATGANDSPFMIIVAALLAYGAAYFLQGRRLLGQREAISA